MTTQPEINTDTIEQQRQRAEEFQHSHYEEKAQILWQAALTAALCGGHPHPWDKADSSVEEFKKRFPFKPNVGHIVSATPPQAIK